jgi:hypothetical protein
MPSRCQSAGHRDQNLTPAYSGLYTPGHEYPAVWQKNRSIFNLAAGRCHRAGRSPLSRVGIEDLMIGYIFLCAIPIGLSSNYMSAVDQNRSLKVELKPATFSLQIC